MTTMSLFNKFHRGLIPVAIKLIELKDAIQYCCISIKNYFLAEKNIIDFKNIPIIINNFNRVTYLKELIECLQKRGYNNIYIIDNNSTYPPLLDYYKTCSCQVYRLNENMGYKAFILSGIYKQFINKYFVYTDSDIYLPEECPENILEYFYLLLKKYPFVSKVGCALKIDDIPDTYKLKSKVQEWEGKYWEKEINKNVFVAQLDTTFTLYKPNFPVGASLIGKNLRVAGRFIAIHRPWYLDSDNLSDEELYYVKTATTSTFWSKQSK